MPLINTYTGEKNFTTVGITDNHRIIAGLQNDVRCDWWLPEYPLSSIAIDKKLQDSM